MKQETQSIDLRLGTTITSIHKAIEAEWSKVLSNTEPDRELLVMRARDMALMLIGAIGTSVSAKRLVEAQNLARCVILIAECYKPIETEQALLQHINETIEDWVAL